MKNASFCMILLAFILIACNLPSLLLPAQSPAIKSITSPATETTLPESQPTETIDISLPTPFLETISPKTPPALPSALLFISQQSGIDQIWRLERDGQSLRQLTSEVAPVIDFDISPIDGRLAYVSGNDLILANPDGSKRTILVDGPSLPDETDPNFMNLQLGKPCWSPDGEFIAYGLGGVNIIDASGDVPFQLILNDDPHRLQDNPTQTARLFFWPESWAPDGKRLLLGYAGASALGGLAVVSTTDDDLTFIQNPPPVEASGKMPSDASPLKTVCCNPIWSLDGTAIYYANPFVGMFSTGLWRADAASGQSQTLIPSQTDDGLYHLPGFVFQAKNSKLYYFYGQTDAFPEGDVMLTPVQAEADALSHRAPLRNDAWLVGEALWSPDAQGVVILDLASAAPAEFPPLGKLIYLPLNGDAAIPLPAAGYALHWAR